jgi:hypothetical protein
LSEEKSWLVRRKPDGDTYPLPPGVVPDKEIWALVNEILSATTGEEEPDAAPPPLWKRLTQFLTK